MSESSNQNSQDFGDHTNVKRDVVAGDKNTYIRQEISASSQEKLTTFEKITSPKLIRTSPYKGLNAFQSRDEKLFFGRDNFIKILVDELESTNLVLLLGGSGRGKSSVVRAGLIPWLAKEHGTEFINLTFTPDADPFESFHASLLSNNYSQKLAKIARQGQAETLIQVVNHLKQPHEFWLIFIDQFEELFTTSDANKRCEFINGLMKLSQAELPKIKIMATMRTDFQDKLSDFPQLVEATQKHRPMIIEMQPPELRVAIEQPAAHHGVVFEAGLVDKIIAEIQGQAGCLPLLQYTLNLLWQDEVEAGAIDDRTLSINTYQKLGGVTGALQQHVNNIYKSLSEPEQQATRRIFLKLVEIGKNVEAGIEWKPVRRRAQLFEFGEDEWDLLFKLVNHNLLVSDADLLATNSKTGLFASASSRKLKSQATIEITHEILLTSWNKLHRWIEENRQWIALRNRLYEDVKRWQAKKPEDELWAGSKLEEVLELRGNKDFQEVLGEFNDEAKQFIRASEEKKNRQLRRARRTAAIGFILAGLTTMAGGFAFVQQQSAQERSIISMTQTAEAHLLLNNQLDAMVEAIRAKEELKKVWIAKDRVSMRVLGALGQAVHHNQQGWKERLRLRGTDVIFSPDGKLLATRDGSIVRIWSAKTGEELQTLQGHQDFVTSVVFSPDGKRVATASVDKTARVWDTETGEELQTLQGHQDFVTSVVFSPDGKRVATASRDKTARVWDTETGEELQTLQGHQVFVSSVVFSPDGERVATASWDKTARVWDTETGEELQTLQGHQDFVNSVVFSRDGKRVATASVDKTARVWDTETGEVLQTLQGHESSVWSVVFSPDGERVATASVDNTARVWDTETGEELQTLQGHESSVESVVFSPDGERVATASVDKTARVWDTETGEVLQTLQGHEVEVNSVVFSPDGKRVATASRDNTARVWATATGEVLQTLQGHEFLVWTAVFSPDGKRVATASVDSTARVWDTATGEELHILRGHQGRVGNAVFSPDGKRVATTSEDKTARIWSAETGEELHILRGHQDFITSVVFSPDGKRVATASEDNTARIWSADTGEELQTLQGHEAGVWSVVFSPDGKRVATASWDNTARVWDTETGEELQTLPGHEAEVNSVVFSPDGERVATVSRDSTARVWDTETGEELQTLRGHESSVLSVVFSPDGKQVATASGDNTARIWSVETGEELQTLQGHESSVLSAVFSPDGKQVATASGDNTARIWSVETGEELQTLPGHENLVNSVVFSPDGKRVATASYDTTARVWQVGDMEDMLAISCDWVRHYLASKPEDDRDRYLCKGVENK